MGTLAVALVLPKMSSVVIVGVGTLAVALVLPKMQNNFLLDGGHS